MKKVFSILLIVGCLLTCGPSSSRAQADPPTLPAAWEVVLYDIGAQEVEIIRPDGVETLKPPECFTASTTPDFYLNYYRHSVAISPDYRFLAVSRTEDFPGIQVADLDNGTCFEAASSQGTSPVGQANIALVSSQNATSTVDVGVFSPDGTRLAFAIGTSISPLSQIVVVDLIDAPGTVLQVVEWEGWPLVEAWRADGITFFNSCYACSPVFSGDLMLWEPMTGTITETGEPFMRAYGDSLLTGETLLAGRDSEYPFPMYAEDYFPNLIHYASADSEAVVYYDPIASVSHPTWVLDGNAFIIEQTLVFRDGSTLPLENSVCPRVKAGTPEGWLMEIEGGIVRCQVVDGEIVSTPTEAVLSGQAVLLRQSPLGATASGDVVQLPFADKFRLSFCESLAQAPRLGYSGQMGHVTTTEPLPLYSAPDTTSATLGTFSSFEVYNGPFCADENTIWWIVQAGEHKGWAPERRDGQPLLELDCPAESASRFQVGAQVVYDGQPPRTGAKLYSMPVQSGDTLGEIALGQTLTVLDGPVCNGERYWWLVDTQGQQGWIIEPEPQP